MERGGLILEEANTTKKIGARFSIMKCFAFKIVANSRIEGLHLASMLKFKPGVAT
jgi:hypothetical protein